MQGVLLDLGVSSPQLDEADRGFSFMQDGPLDMRMDNETGQTAAQWLARASEREIADTLHRLGEEKFARRIARAIVAARAEAPIERTRPARDGDRRRGARRANRASIRPRAASRPYACA